ncbi:hypothetical protein DY000_02063634 [Brassica cretica]|uniref:Protein kinase domain-containing protein n=1 Tax=Brassica cretica TaxID=69181 RepID=A0ABQ7AZR5_BRACR|nr:hypothetical protein DY000_02063634 [Brassica cretica]
MIDGWEGEARVLGKCEKKQEYDVEDSMLPVRPYLNYTAPELVRSKSPSAGASSDIFSFGCLAYHLVSRKPLLDCNNNVKMYLNTLNYITNETFSSIPSDLVSDLQRMLSMNETFRPTALDFTGSSFFRSDARLRALRFLDHMLERDNMQKSEFLKALSDMWKDFDSRVLRYKVLPPLCAELRNLVLQPIILPMVLTIAQSQTRKMEEKRGVTVSDSGVTEATPQWSTQTPEKVGSAAKSSPAWDEDWDSPSKDSAVGNHASSHQVTNNQFNKSSNQSQTLPNKSTAPTTCPSVDIVASKTIIKPHYSSNNR